jgi:hypothetical protein
MITTIPTTPATPTQTNLAKISPPSLVMQIDRTFLLKLLMQLEMNSESKERREVM